MTENLMMTDELLSKARKMVATRQESGIERAIADSLALVAWRHLIYLSRTPEVMASVVLFPIIFLSGFLLTFQRLMANQGIDYVQYLLPIITLQAIFFTAMSSAVTIASDIKSSKSARNGAPGLFTLREAQCIAGDWGLGRVFFKTREWGLNPISKFSQSPVPNPQSPVPRSISIFVR